MQNLHRKILVAALAFGLAIALMGWAAWREGWVYYMTVDEFALIESPQQRIVRLHGEAGFDDFQVSHGGLWAKFYMVGQDHAIRVEYNGVIPDMFVPGHEVIIEGILNEDGIFQASTLMTKCGSRYESEEDAIRMPHASPLRTNAAVDGTTPGGTAGGPS